MTDLGSSLPALAGVVLGGGFSYLVMRGEVKAAREQRQHDRLAEVISDYWAAIDRYDTINTEGFVLRQRLEQTPPGPERDELENQAEDYRRQHRLGKAACRELLGKVRVFFPELELCAYELLLASGAQAPGYEQVHEEERDEKLRAFEAAAREALGVPVRPGVTFFVPAGGK